MVDIATITEASNSSSTLLRTTEFLFNEFLTDITIAVIILVIGLLIGQFVKKIVLSMFTTFHINQIIAATTSVHTKLDELFSSICAWIIYIFALLFALRQLGLATVVVNSIFIFLLILILILLFLSLKDFIPNLLAGLLIHTKKYISQGDTIQLALAQGTVETIDLYQTIVVTKKGDYIHIPNSYIVKNRYVVVKKKSVKKKKQS